MKSLGVVVYLSVWHSSQCWKICDLSGKQAQRGFECLHMRIQFVLIVIDIPYSSTATAD